MRQGQHVPLARLQEVATHCYVMLTEVEQAHVKNCEECLAVFEALVMPSENSEAILQKTT